jgi:hypothetical protein
MAQELDASFVKEGKERIVADMTSVIHVRDPHRYFACEYNAFGKVDFDARHGRFSEVNDGDVTCKVGKIGVPVNERSGEVVRWPCNSAQGEP